MNHPLGSTPDQIRFISDLGENEPSTYPEHKASRGEEHAFDQTNKVPKEP